MSFEEVVSYWIRGRSWQDAGEPEQIVTVSTERGLFRMLGAGAMAGRTFRDDDPDNVVVLGAGFWRRHLAGHASVIGRKITLDGDPFTVIGVMPDSFQFPYRATPPEMWIPWRLPVDRGRWGQVEFVTARLKPGVTIEAARNELAVISERLEAQYPETNTGRRARVTPLSEQVSGSVRRALLTLLGAVGLVLLIACANVANLLLARSASRGQEIAVRAALGAGRARLVRQFLTESLLLATVGGLAGLMLAAWGAKLLLALAGPQIPRASEIGLDWRAFAFLLAVCAVTGIGFGLAPALAASRVDVQTGLKDSTRQGSPGRRQGVVRDGLVIAEIAIAFMLLMGAGLLLRAFLYLERTDAGFVAENVLTLQMEARYGAGPQAAAHYYRELEDRIEKIPGVRAAGFITRLPLQDPEWRGRFAIAGRPPEPPLRLPFADLRYVSPGYFRALGIPLRRGRNFTDRDNHESAPVVLITETLARQFFPNEDPIGRSLVSRGTIIGVVGDVRQWGLDRPPAPGIYYTLAQSPYAGVRLVVSTAMPPPSLVNAVRAAIHEVNPNQAVFNVKTMQRVVAESLADLNLYVWLMGLFAAIALVLAVGGIYGVISYAVTARTQEFGIRIALGADAATVLRLVLSRGVVLIAIGLAAGGAGAFAFTRVLKSFLAGVTPTDPATFVAVSVLLAAVAVAACLIPARRAMRVNPIIALRYE